MGVCVYFALSTGLSRAVVLPWGMMERVRGHVEWMRGEGVDVGLESYLENPPRWTVPYSTLIALGPGVWCEVAMRHNGLIREVYEAGGEGRPESCGELVTPEEFGEVIPYLARILHPPVEVWTGEYYRGRMAHARVVMMGGGSEGWMWPEVAALSGEQADGVISLMRQWLDPEGLGEDEPLASWTAQEFKDRMEVVYEAMRGRAVCRHDNVVWPEGVERLTPEQAGAALWVFHVWMDRHDIRLEVPHGCDCLGASYWGEYTWCDTCGAVSNEDVTETWVDDEDDEGVLTCDICGGEIEQ